MAQTEFQSRLSPQYKKRSYNATWVGLVTGLVVPIIIFTGYYLILHRRMLIISFFHYLNLGNIFTPILSLCIIPDLLLFYIFIWTKRDKSAWGVVAAVIIYALLLAIMKMA